MKVIPTQFKEVFLLNRNHFVDKRGSFYESFNLKFLESQLDLKLNFCQDNFAFSNKGVLRGLHYQLYPYTQSKLVSVVKGKVLDVVVDIRKGSPTFGQHLVQELSYENQLQLFIPRGFAHGYITLSNESIFHYKVDNYYNPKKEGSIAPNDPELGLDWLISERDWIQSDKDLNHPQLKDAILFDYKQNLYV